MKLKNIENQYGAILEEALTQLHEEGEQDNGNLHRVRTHAFMVTYSTSTDLDIPRKLVNSVMPLIKEMKRNIENMYKEELWSIQQEYNCRVFSKNNTKTIKGTVSPE